MTCLNSGTVVGTDMSRMAAIFSGSATIMSVIQEFEFCLSEQTFVFVQSGTFS